MKLTDVYTAKAIANVYTEVGSNKIAYLGAGLFPAQKKAGLDLRIIKTSKGLPVSLAPSAFDTNSTIRSREGVKILDTEMAFFKESMLISEKDEQDMMRVQEAADPYAQDILNRVFDDAVTLCDGAEVVAERMRMSLLANENGKPSISISANGATYAYDYDPDGSYVENNFTELLDTDRWDDTENSDPLQDISDACDKVESYCGSRPAYILMSNKTMTYLRKNKNIRNSIIAQGFANTTFLTAGKVKQFISDELNVEVLVYTKLYKDDEAVAKKFYPDGMVTLLPQGALGKTFRGTTPEERTLSQRADANVSLVNDGVAVAVTITDDPVHTKTTVSEIVLPSFERMDETYMIKVYDVSYNA